MPLQARPFPTVTPDPQDIPLVPLDLLEALDKRYPEACAEVGQTMDELMFYGGKRDLIRWLRLKYNEQQQAPSDSEEEEAK